MKLDNIIYDTDTLASAITEQWNTESEAFKAMYPSDTATSLVNVFAGYGSMLQYMLLGALANCYTTTAYSEAGIYQLADTLGNNLHGNISAQVTVAISKNNFIGIQTVIPAKTQFLIKGKKFFNPSAIILPATSTAIDNIVLVQGEILSVSQTTSGIANEKIYFSTDFKANHNYVQVYINSIEWNVVNSFLEYDKNYVLDSSELNVVVLKTEPDGRACIKFGDNQVGALPASGSTVQIEYVSNDGTDGNISEIGVAGSLGSSLLYTDNDGTTGNLSVNIVTTSTAYGGSNVQSTDILRYTSPYVFASGHRAVRRQDYTALLQNECGYLTSNVWGEYEEANKVGAYDALMMNMVYYTGIKSFQTYPSFNVGKLNSSSSYTVLLNSTAGFWGSFTLTIENNKNSNSYITLQDNGANGILFFNKNTDDPRDSMLPIWVRNETAYYIGTLSDMGVGQPEGIVTAGSGYKINDILSLKYNSTASGYIVKVKTVDGNGAVTDVDLVTDEITGTEYATGTIFTTDYVTPPSTPGTGLTIKLDITKELRSPVISTNDDTGEIGFVNLNPIANARSDRSTNLYYVSQHEPTLQNPVQIKLNFDAQSQVGAETSKSIVGVKFKAASATLGPFIGTMAMFATNDYNTFIYDTDNVRNSSRWVKIMQRTTLDNPQGDTENDGWTNWISTNVFSGETLNGEPVFDSYKYYIIEIYSLSEANETASNLVVFNKIKFLFSDQASLLYYDDNGKVVLDFPEEGDPGPDGVEAQQGNYHDTIPSDLINTDTFPLWYYIATLSGITASNDYRDGNVLAYIYTDPVSQTQTPFLVSVINTDSGVYETSIKGDTSLTGKYSIATENPVSLDTNLVYEEQLPSVTIASAGTGYTVGDILTLKTKNSGLTSSPDLQLYVTTTGNSGTVTGVSWKLTDYTKQYKIGEVYVGTFETEVATSSSGTGCTINVTAQTCSGIVTPITITTAGTGYTRWGKVAVNTALTTYQGTVCTVGSNGEVTGIKLEHNSSPETTTTGSGLVVTALNTIGHGAKISIATENNLTLNASFTGNRIDTSTINMYDQPIIKKYNHFTTYLEFQQPSIKQESIVVQVSLSKNTSTTSGIILQNIKNSLYDLFTIKPDYIGKGLKLSTIYTTVMNVKDVEWCKVVHPVNNIDTGINELLVASTIKVIDVTEQ